jgi:hypothetical protein
MKKIIPFVWSLGVGSALALALLKPLKQPILRKNLLRKNSRKKSSDEDMYYI